VKLQHQLSGRYISLQDQQKFSQANTLMSQSLEGVPEQASSLFQPIDESEICHSVNHIMELKPEAH